jgi:hypothetical protein
MKNVLNEQAYVGYILIRKIDKSLTHQRLISELLFFYLELQIILLAIKFFQMKKLKMFDGLVGDQKCQVRASILVDLYENFDKNIEIFNKEKKNIDFLIKKYEKLFIELDLANYPKIKKSKINYNSIFDLFFLLKLFFEPPLNLKILSLSLITMLNKKDLFDLSKNKLGREKIDSLVDMAKIELSSLSIEYEQKIAKKYSSISVQMALQQIGTKKYSIGYSSMTAFFPSWIAIWDKMQLTHQIFLKKLFSFCKCGGIEKIFFEIYKFRGRNLCKIAMNSHDKNVAMIILSYRYKGSFNKLKEILHTSNLKDTIIPTEYLFYCKCSNNANVIKNIELEKNHLADGINAVFAQHPQFINKIEIDWVGLGLENSELKKEYDRLRTLSGYGINDMSKFCIVHIYASTVGQELEEQRELLAKLGKK